MTTAYEPFAGGVPLSTRLSPIAVAVAVAMLLVVIAAVLVPGESAPASATPPEGAASATNEPPGRLPTPG